MSRISPPLAAVFCLVASGCLVAPGAAMSAPLQIVPEPPAAEPQEASAVQLASNQRGHMGGGFIEFLFGGGYQPNSRSYGDDLRHAPQPRPFEQPAMPDVDPKYDKQLVDYFGKEAPGTIVIDTPQRFLYLVQPDNRALRYGIGVGRPGFTWAGVKNITMKREWPDWTPPPEMLKRRPDLPRFMEGGPDNPLGARALYLGSSLYRIHGSNEPWTIGTEVSSGCIRMRNEDVIDLYERVRVGARVVVI